MSNESEQPVIQFLAIGLGVWGKGDTARQALYNAKAEGGSEKYVVFVVGKEWDFNGFSVRSDIVKRVGSFNRRFQLLKDD